MRRRFDWWIALALAVLVVLAFALVQLHRPDSLDLQVTARDVGALTSLQRVEVTIQWHWLRRLQPLFGGDDAIGLVYDSGRWGLENAPGSLISAPQDAMLAAWGEPRSAWRIPVRAGEDGALKITLFANGAAAGYRATALPFRAQYIRFGGILDPSAAFSWVRGAGGVLPLR